MTDRFLIVGLGNPGRDYEKTRHNIGFRVAEALAAKHGLSFAKKQAKALLAEGSIAERRVLIAKPQTYMNLSGESVRPLVSFYNIPLANVLIILDDLDIPLGTLRLRPNGSAGGQNGMKSILGQLGTQNLARLRFGIGRPPGRMDAAAYVLQPFATDEQMLVIETLDRAVRAAETWLQYGIETAMTRHNGTAEEAARNATATAPIPKPEPTSE
ncbi:MAG: aminoacyl-tRNA hydrolase [Chloroflexi bacterium CFX4]|nr:aminoacyl-tRNA hydrolase [Chloroflexi bacterium CFX4]MDL1922165.1 aminoacyl-tRNA hydrolase [Chloroflexi bacterium CFX3]